MPKLKIDTATSLYEPIEVEIDGQKFTLRRITREKLREIEELDRAIGEGNLDAAYKRLEVFFGPSEAFSKLDLCQVGELVRFVVRAILNPETAEKNLSNPGEAKQP